MDAAAEKAVHVRFRIRVSAVHSPMFAHRLWPSWDGPPQPHVRVGSQREHRAANPPMRRARLMPPWAKPRES